MKKIVFIFLFLLFLFPQFEKQFNLFHFDPLSGYTISNTNPQFRFKDWFDGKFQSAYEQEINENFGFRNFLVRLYNSFDFSVFHKTNNSTIVIGKDNYLFQQDYIDEITGNNFIGVDAMKSNIDKLKWAQNYLANKNIFLLTVIAPAKTYYFSEYLPECFLKKVSVKTNYTEITGIAKAEKLNFIDLNNWFMNLKHTNEYPLFPKYGIHWNYYGMALSVDSIATYITKENKSPLSKIQWDLELTDTIHGTDYDLGLLLNIFEKLPSGKIPYPRFKIQPDSTIPKPRLLVIGDSFYWTIFNENVFGKIFSNETYYYYCNTIHPDGRALSDNPADLNFLKEIEKYDIIILLQSSANYGNPGVNFLQLFNGELRRREIYKNKTKALIAENDSLNKFAIQISSEMKIPKDSAVSVLADSLTDIYFQKISDVKLQMRTNPDWIAQMKEKASLRNISLEEMMQTDAEWIIKREEANNKSNHLFSLKFNPEINLV